MTTKTRELYRLIGRVKRRYQLSLRVSRAHRVLRLRERRLSLYWWTSLSMCWTAFLWFAVVNPYPTGAWMVLGITVPILGYQVGLARVNRALLERLEALRWATGV